jgi:micrococcal nuclease
MAKKKSLLLIVRTGCASLLGLCLVCATASAIVDALNFVPENPTPVSQRIAVDQKEASQPVVTQPLITDTPIPPTIEFVPTETISPITTPTSVPVALAECVRPDAEQVLAQVIGVTDGDTIEVIFDNQVYKVRYIGMDAPESATQKEPLGDEATAKNRELVEGKTVILIKDVRETDPYDRLLRYVFVDDLFVNYELVRQGYANVVSYPPDVACIDTFRIAENEARNTEVGLWAAPPPTATILVVVQPTAIPPTQVVVQPTVIPRNQLIAQPTKEPVTSGNCHPSYPGVCLAPNAGDYDCQGGSGNGPNYIAGPITVRPPDPFDLDRDRDGIGCE